MSEQNKMFAIKIDAHKLVSHLLEHVKTQHVVLGVADDGNGAVLILHSVKGIGITENTKWLAMPGELEFIDLTGVPVDLMAGNTEIKIQ